MTKKVDEFELHDALGEGSYGQVYLATGPDGPVALKMLRGDRLTPQMRGRFQLECEALARAKGHPNIVQPLSEMRESENGSVYIALEYVEGGTLGTLLTETTLGTSQLFKISTGLARALQRTHELGFLHRDLCTGNVLLTREFEPKLADFGLCRESDRSRGLTPDFWFAHGDPQSAAPERLFHIESGEVGDAYSLGCLIYHMCTGRSYFRLGKLSMLHSVYTKQMEQFFRSCMNQDLPCPLVDFTPVYEYYLQHCPTSLPGREELAVALDETTWSDLSAILQDLLQADYRRRLERFGSLAEVVARLGQLARNSE